MRICTHIEVYEPSEDGYRLFMVKLDDICQVVIFRPPYLRLSIHAKPYKFDLEYNVSSNISRTKHRTDLNLCETLSIFTFFDLVEC